MRKIFSNGVFKYYFLSLLALVIFYFAGSDYFYVILISSVDASILFWLFLVLYRFILAGDEQVEMGKALKLFLLVTALIMMFSCVYFLSLKDDFASAVASLSLSLMIFLSLAT